MTEKKKCKKCTSTKPLNDFYKFKKSNDGHQCYCKKCQKQYQETYHNSKKTNCGQKQYYDTSIPTLKKTIL